MDSKYINCPIYYVLCYIYKQTRTNGEKAEKITVDTTTLDNIFKENRIEKCDLLKIDCEGAECEILFNASKENIRNIKEIVGEHHQIEHCDREEFKKFLENSGFTVNFSEGKIGDAAIPICNFHAINQYFK